MLRNLRKVNMLQHIYAFIDPFKNLITLIAIQRYLDIANSICSLMTMRTRAPGIFIMVRLLLQELCPFYGRRLGFMSSVKCCLFLQIGLPATKDSSSSV